MTQLTIIQTIIVTGQKDVMGKTVKLLNVAVAELAGHIPIYCKYYCVCLLLVT